jgi:hypothetical protein
MLLRYISRTGHLKWKERVDVLLTTGLRATQAHEFRLLTDALYILACCDDIHAVPTFRDAMSDTER